MKDHSMFKSPLKTILGAVFRSPKGDLRHDFSEGHPDFEELLFRFESRDWKSFESLLCKHNADNRFLLIRAVGDCCNMVAEIGDFPETPTVLTAIGGIYTRWAWRERGFGRGHEVSEEGWQACYERAEAAVGALNAAVDSQIDNGVAWGFFVRALTVLSASEADLDVVEERLLASSDRPLEAYIMLLQARARKWLGSHEDMYRIAKLCAEDETLHPARFGIMARAHIERWLWDGNMDNDLNFRTQNEDLLSQPHMQENLRSLNARFWEAITANPHLASQRAAMCVAHNNFAVAMLLANLDGLNEHLERIGAHPTHWPWVYVFGSETRSHLDVIRRELNMKRLTWPETVISPPPELL